jgi:hypothetical protein
MRGRAGMAIVSVQVRWESDSSALAFRYTAMGWGRRMRPPLRELANVLLLAPSLLQERTMALL